MEFFEVVHRACTTHRMSSNIRTSSTPAQVAAADALARVTWEEFAQLYAALETDADRRQTEAN